LSAPREASWWRRTPWAPALAALVLALALALGFVVKGMAHVIERATQDWPAPTRIVETPDGLRGLTLRDAFPELDLPEFPVVMVPVPGRDQFFVVAREGRILSVPADGSPAGVRVVLDISERVLVEGEQGLIGLAFDPRFEENGYVYVFYSTPGVREERTTVLERMEARESADTFVLEPETALRMLQVFQPGIWHKSGQLAFGPDGYLYVSIGDGGNPQGGNRGQDLVGDLLGTIIRIDVSNSTADMPYMIPRDNPFASDAGGARPETWAYGLRNAWRFSFDRETGTLIAADVGQSRSEEINIIEPGVNYGWELAEGRLCYRRRACDDPALRGPVIEYRHRGRRCAAIGGYVYRGTAIPELSGVYIYGDHCTGEVWGAYLDDLRAGIDRPFLLVDSDEQVVAFAQDPAGEVYVMTGPGGVYRLVR
jgi:glucose/arabinose dehydrogenase